MIEIGVRQCSARELAILVERQRIEEDVPEAQRLLAEAGYPGGEGFPAVDFLYSTSDSGKYLSEVLQQMWQKNLGVHVDINNQEWKVFLTTTEQRDFSIATMGWLGDFLDPVTYLDTFVSDNGNNRTGYDSAEYDRLIDQARRTANKDERYRLFGEAETLLLRDAPVNPLYYRARSFLCRPEVEGFPGNLLDYRRFDRMAIGAAQE